MATPTTLTEARTAYLASVGYRRAGSVSMAQDFEEACMALLILQPVSAQHSGEITEFEPGLIEKQLEQVRQWIAANDTSGQGAGSARFFSFEDFRT